MLLLKLVGCEVGMCLVILLKEVGDNLLESLLALLLGQSSLGGLICRSIKLILNLLAQLLIVNLVVVCPLHVSTKFLGKFLLKKAHRLDGLGSSLERADKVLLGHFLHLSLYHHDVVLGGTNHDIHISLLHLLEGRINDILAIDTCYTHLRDVVLKGNI